MRRRENFLKMVDWWTIGFYLILVLFGWLTIFAACYDFESETLISFTSRNGKQLVWIGLAFVLALVVMLIDSKFYHNVAYVFYGLMILLLIATIFLAPDIKGSHSWLRIGPLQVQPAEFAKYATILCLSRFMSTYQFSFKGWRNILTVAGIILLPMLIIVLQSETGSALVFASLLLVLYREGMNGIILVLGGLVTLFFILVLRYNNLPEMAGSPEMLGYIIVAVIAVLVAASFVWIYTRNKSLTWTLLGSNAVLYAVGALLNYFFPVVLFTYVAYTSLALSILLLFVWAMVQRRSTYLWVVLFLVGTAFISFSANYAFNVLAPHQQIRIKIVLGLEDDPQGAGYNVRQSQIAIGSGGIIGKGFLHGTQTKLNYVPEQDTDFIFCTIGEEQGFSGSAFFVVLYVVFLLRLIYLAERQRSAFSRIYGYCLVSILLFHFFINLGMVTGMLPVIGIPLPFISYGGSSLWGFTVMLFTFIRLDANRMEVLQQY